MATRQKKGAQLKIPKGKLNQYSNRNPDDSEERFAKFQLHRKTATSKKGNQYFQAMVMLPAAIQKKLKWTKGDMLVMKVDQKSGILMVRRIQPSAAEVK